MTVVHDFSLDVAAGEFVSLLGPSGCGKTTILRTIAGFIGAASGSITLEGQDITRKPAEQRDVGIVFQNYALFPTMSAFENIAFGLRVAKRPMAEITQRVTDIARASGIEEQLHKRPSDMSGGQQQRVAIARALITGAKVLLFDEPLSNLDSKVRVAMRREIKRLQAEFGFTAFFVTHDQDEALSMSDRVIVLKDGHTQQIGTGRVLYEQPQNAFVCKFIGDANALTAGLAKALTGQVRDGTVFVRPENTLMNAGHAGVPACVTHIEYLGAQVRVECQVGAETVLATMYGFECPPDLSVGQDVSLSVRPGAWHIFPDTPS
ncbi:ABC transporter ATP-binding protein [uncultured Tateyamaria sp.]|uniref:ABC transporter ATP-binding protein n=1 Tax=uncultured Tateyamaria sp. TaxID=455651 RepID=UPI0026260F1C|nr:ABC transporter ATP-binding protein [uncultured Tateyamaria sp.]